MTDPAYPAYPASRLQGIDAARGFAMLLVFLSHFSFEFFKAPEPPASAKAIWVVTLIASPSFMLLSGMMLGLLKVTRGEAFLYLRRRLLLRGVFLLTIGHALIVIAVIPRSSSLGAALSRGFITDVIGVGLVLIPVLMHRLRVGERLALAFSLVTVSLALHHAWAPVGATATVARYLLVGPGSASPDLFNFPLLPWLGIYLSGTCIGEWASRAAMQGGVRTLERRLALVGSAAFVLGAGIKIAYLLARSGGLIATGVTPLYLATSPLLKMPPSLPYLLVFGGMGLMMTASMLWLCRRRWSGPITSRLSILGKASLFVFLLQFYVYFVGFHYLHLPWPELWPLYFAASVVPIYLAAQWWLARGLNSLFAFRLIPNALRRVPRPDAPGTALVRAEREGPLDGG